MGIFRIEKDQNFTIMSNYHLRDKELSLKSKGLLSYMLSLPEDWDYSLNGLVAICKESKDAIKSSLSELKTLGYLKIEQSRDQNGKFGYIYLIYEKPPNMPQKNEILPMTDFPSTEEPTTEEPLAEKPTQINTNKQNTKELNTNNKDKKDKSCDLDELLEEMNNADELRSPLVDDLINTKYIKEDDKDLNKYDELFKELTEKGCTYGSLLNSIYYIAPKVVARDFIDENGKRINDKFSYFKASIELNNKKLKEINKRSQTKKGLWDDFEL